MLVKFLTAKFLYAIRGDLLAEVKLVCYTAVFGVVVSGEERCVTTLKTAV